MATRRSRRYPLLEYLKLERAEIAELNAALREASDALYAQLRRDLPSGLVKAQLEAQRAAINAIIDSIWDSVGVRVEAAKQAAAVAASRVISEYEDELLSLVLSPMERELLATSLSRTAASSLDTVLARITKSRRTLSGAVYRNQALSHGAVNKLINQALAQGWSAATFANQVRKYISPTVKGGASYAAQRLARTEINNAFHAATIDRADNDKIVELMAWNLSTSHPEGDECDDYAKRGPYLPREVPAKPHPQCLCFLSFVLPDRETFLTNLLNGEYGDEPWAA